MSVRLGVAIALALVPGALAWAGSRRLLRRIDDPLFVEQLFAHRVKMIYLYTFIIVVATTLAPRAGVWLGMLSLLAIAVGGFPARRTLYGETWTLPAYLASRIRLIAGAGAPWIGLMAGPWAVQTAGIRFAPLVFVILFTLFFFQQRLLLWGLKAKPLEDEPLRLLLDPITAKTKAPPPALFTGGAETGRFTNAFALPDGKRSRVVLTRALLRELEPRETAAVFAHESAHLEQWATRGMRIQVWIGRLTLPLLAVLPQVYLLPKYAQAANWLSVLWPLIFTILIMTALVRRQAHESAADLRALELGADPLALISGLEKLHKMLGAPRRVDVQREKRMTHPSLARRIQAIRKAAGLEVMAPPELPREFPVRNSTNVLRFTTEAVETSQPVRTYRYDSLQSLLLRQTIGGWELAGRSGKERIRVPLTAETAAEVQTILDAVDIHFVQAPAAAVPIARSARLMAVVVFLASLFPSISFPPLVAAVLVLISASAPALAALGATAIAAALFAIRYPSMPFLDDVLPAIAAAEALLGLVCLLLVRKIPADQRQRFLRATVITLTVFAAIVVVPALITMTFGQPLARLFLIARDRPSVAVLLTGIAAALFVAGRLRAATVTASVLIAFLVIGTQIFGAATANDALLTARQPAWVAPPKRLKIRTFDGMANAIRLSPGGIAHVVRFGYDEDEEESKYAVGLLSADLYEFRASHVAFVDDHTLLRVTTDDTAVHLDTLDVYGKSGAWRVDLPPMWRPTVSAAADGTWTVTGHSVNEYSPRRFTGRVGMPGYASSRHSVYASTVVPRMPWLSMLSGGAMGTEFLRNDNGKLLRLGRTLLHAADTHPLPETKKWAVAGSDSRSTYVATIDESTGKIRPAGTIAGRVSRVESGRGSRIVLTTPTNAVVWNLESGKAMRINCGDCVVIDGALSDRAVGVLVARSFTTSLELYSTDALR